MAIWFIFFVQSNQQKLPGPLKGAARTSLVSWSFPPAQGIPCAWARCTPEACLKDGYTMVYQQFWAIWVEETWWNEVLKPLDEMERHVFRQSHIDTLDSFSG